MRRACTGDIFRYWHRTLVTTVVFVAATIALKEDAPHRLRSHAQKIEKIEQKVAHHKPQNLGGSGKGDIRMSRRP